MTHKNLVLSENAVKRHCKRLQQLMKHYNQKLSLGEIQNLFSKTLGFNNFHELKQILNQEQQKNPFTNMLDKFESKSKDSLILLYIRPVKKMQQRFQKELKNFLLQIETKMKEEHIYFLENHINEDSCCIYLDPNSKFVSMDNKYGTTIYGALYSLSHNILKIMQQQDFDLFYNFEIGYKVNNNIHITDLLTRD